ncbi:MAG: folate-binding protein [Pseudomonadota bacterium]
MTSHSAKLSDRAVIRLSGPDWKAMLQGLITNTVDKIAPDSWLYAGLLSPQGKYLFDFFITRDGEDAVMDVAAEQRDTLVRKLMMYRLRSKVDITPTDDAIYAHWGETFDTHLDPRLPAMGQRRLQGEDTASAQDYKAHRIRLGIPDGPLDFIADKTLWLETNADLLNGVDFQKGCYVGQENTARMRYRGKVRRRLIPIQSDAPIPEHTPIMLGRKQAGDTRSSSGTHALANLRVEDLNKEPFMVGDTEIKAWIPEWLKETVEAAREPA